MAGKNQTVTIAGILDEDRFESVSRKDKAFIVAFDGEMKRLGYDFGGVIGSGFCWGHYMVIYRKVGVKSKKVYARIYLRDNDIVLRLFLSKVDRHRAFIEGAPAHIKQVFAGPSGDCNHCDNEKEGQCKFRKDYTLEDRRIEKCNGVTFRFEKPRIGRMVDYIDLFTEFYPDRKRKKVS